MTSDAGSSGWLDLLESLVDAGLPAPPLPPHLRPLLRRQHEWCWSTHPVDADAMYQFGSAVESGGDDYAAVSHAGHGVNSYGLNVYICGRALAAFLQFHWGGIYADASPVVGARMLRAFAYLNGLAHSMDAPAGDRRHVVAFSDFRRVAHFGTVSSSMSLPGDFTRPAAFEAGVRVTGIDAALTLDGLDWLFQGAARAWCPDYITEKSLGQLVLARNLLVRWYWPNCPFPGRTPATSPVDAFLVEATEAEAEALVWPRMTAGEVARSRALMEQSRALALEMGSMRPVAFLVSRDLKVIEPVICNAAAAGHEGSASSFQAIAPRNVTRLEDLVRVDVSLPRGLPGAMWLS